MREQLYTEIVNTFSQYRNNLPFEDIKAQITGNLYTFGYVMKPENRNNICKK